MDGLTIEAILAQMARTDGHHEVLQSLWGAHQAKVTEVGLFEAAVLAATERPRCR